MSARRPGARAAADADLAERENKASSVPPPRTQSRGARSFPKDTVACPREHDNGKLPVWIFMKLDMDGLAFAIGYCLN
jgi:hypothetical protein